MRVMSFVLATSYSVTDNVLLNISSTPPRLPTQTPVLRMLRVLASSRQRSTIASRELNC